MNDGEMIEMRHLKDELEAWKGRYFRLQYRLVDMFDTNDPDDAAERWQKQWLQFHKMRRQLGHGKDDYFVFRSGLADLAPPHLLEELQARR